MVTSNLVSMLRACDSAACRSGADEIERLTRIVKALTAGAKRLGYDCPHCHAQVVFGDSICPVTKEQHATPVETSERCPQYWNVCTARCLRPKCHMGECWFAAPSSALPTDKVFGAMPPMEPTRE